jgi:hypothetical protein
MSLKDKIVKFMRKSHREKVASIRRHSRNIPVYIHDKIESLSFQKIITGNLVLPNVLRSKSRVYISYRPDADVNYDAFPELRSLGDNWVANNLVNNAGDLSRLYALSLNIRQTIADLVEGDFAELGVYRGNSAAVLAYYARQNDRHLEPIRK